MFKWIDKLMEKIRERLSENGQGMVEYALIIAVVAVIAMLVLNTNLRSAITGAFESAGEQITTTTDDINTMRDDAGN